MALAFASGISFYLSEQKAPISDMILENAEALALGENQTCEICYGFELVSYRNGCKICEPIAYGPCNVHDQIPC